MTVCTDDLVTEPTAIAEVDQNDNTNNLLDENGRTWNPAYNACTFS